MNNVSSPNNPRAMAEMQRLADEYPNGDEGLEENCPQTEWLSPWRLSTFQRRNLRIKSRDEIGVMGLVCIGVNDVAIDQERARSSHPISGV